MGASERLQVWVNNELALDAGACSEGVSGAHGPEWLIRPPMTTLFSQVLACPRRDPNTADVSVLFKRGPESTHQAPQAKSAWPGRTLLCPKLHIGQTFKVRILRPQRRFSLPRNC